MQRSHGGRNNVITFSFRDATCAGSPCDAGRAIGTSHRDIRTLRSLVVNKTLFWSFGVLALAAVV